MKEGYKDSVLGEIPIDWDVSRLENVCLPKEGLRRGPFGGTIKKVFFVEEGFQVYEQRNAIYDDFKTARYFIDESKYKELKAFHVQENDFIVSCSGTIGRIAKVPSDFRKGVINQALLRIRLDRTILSDDYFLQQFRFEPFQNKIIDSTQGGAMKNLVGMSEFRKSFILIPPVPEQQKIAEILSTVDDKIDVIDQQISESQTLKKGLMQRLLTKGIGHTEFKDSSLGEIPESWEVVKLGEICSEITYGLTVRPKYIEEGVPLISAKEIVAGVIDYEVAQKISQQDFESLSEKAKPKEGDLFLSKTGTIGRSAIYMGERPIAITQNIAILRVEHPHRMHRQFILQYMKFTHFLKSAISKVNQSTIMDLQLGDIKTILIPNPSVHEQQKISDILSSVDEKLEVLSSKKTYYQELKKGLMQQLLTGKIRVNGIISKTAIA